jgi:hypothetical protein
MWSISGSTFKLQVLDYPTPGFPHQAVSVFTLGTPFSTPLLSEFFILRDALLKHALHSIEVPAQHSPFFFRCHLQHTRTWEGQ